MATGVTETEAYIGSKQPLEVICCIIVFITITLYYYYYNFVDAIYLYFMTPPPASIREVSKIFLVKNDVEL